MPVVALERAVLQVAKVDARLTDREQVRREREAVPGDPAVQRARACGIVTVPTHRLLPDTRRVPDTGGGDVRARNDLADPGRNTRGIHVYLWGQDMLRHPAHGPLGSEEHAGQPLIPVPGSDAVPIARSEGFAAHASC